YLRAHKNRHAPLARGPICGHYILTSAVERWIDWRMDMSKTYGVTSSDGTINSSGMTREQAMRRAQEIADQTGEPAEVYAEPAQEGDEPVAVVQPSGDEITDEQIEQLRTEAAQAGDLVMVAICDVALAQHLDEIADVDDSVR